MRLSHRQLLTVIALICFSAATCAVSKKNRESGTEALNKSSSQVVKRLLGQQHDQIMNFSGKAKVKYDDGDQRISFATQLRIKKSKYIWINASFLSYEVARILIRPDSIFAINRLEKSFIAESYTKFNRSYEIPATFTQLEAMLLGNTVIDLQLPHVFGVSERNYQLQQQIREIEVEESIDPINYRTNTVGVRDDRSGYQISANYDDFRNGLDSKDFSYFRQYIIKKDNAQVANIQIQFSNVEAVEKKAPFEIPAHYERAD